MEDCRSDLSHTVRTVVEASWNILREEFDNFVDNTFVRTLEISIALALITETMERATSCHLYFCNLARYQWKTNGVNGVSQMVSATVHLEARHAVETKQGTQRSHLKALFDVGWDLQK